MDYSDLVSDDMRRRLWLGPIDKRPNATTANESADRPTFSAEAFQEASRLANRDRSREPTEIWEYPDKDMARLGLDVGKSSLMEAPNGSIVLVISSSALAAIERSVKEDPRLADAGPMTGFFGLPIRRMATPPETAERAKE